MRTVAFAKAVKDNSAGNTRIPQSEYQSAGRIPILDQGREAVAGYTDQEDAAANVASPCIIFGDHTRNFKYVNFPFAVGADGVKVLSVQNGFDPKYVYYYLKSLEIPSAGYSRHFKFLKEVTVPQPPLEDQQRIAAILDYADALRGERRKMLAHFECLTQELFWEMFGAQAWPRQPLARISRGAGQYGANVPSVEPRFGLPRYVRITDITDSGALTKEARSPGGPAQDWQKFRLTEGDILFARSGATVGKSYLYRSGDGNCVFAGYLIRFQPDPTVIDPLFLSAFTRTPTYWRWVSEHKNTVAQPNINAKQYGNELLVPVPPLALQGRFASHVRDIEAEKKRVEGVAALSDELFASLQSRAFRGEL